MRYLLIIVLLALAGCAGEKPYGIPGGVWSQLTSEQKKAVIEYNAKKQAKEKNNWIWKNSAEKPEPAPDVKKS